MVARLSFVALVLAGLSMPNGDVLVLDDATCMLIDLDNDGIAFQPKSKGVQFDVDADGTREPVGWTTAGSNDGFLVMDVNKNGKIDSGRELIGNRFLVRGQAMPNGLRALIALQDGIVLDKDFKALALPPGAGFVDKDDRVYFDLQIWIDANHDGRSSPDELQPLLKAGISSIKTGMHGPESSQNGTRTLMVGSVMLVKRGVEFPRTLIEVALDR